MSINKAFVVKNSFEVSTDLVLANADTRRVGIGITNPRYLLDVAGGIGATDFYLSGIGTFANELNVGLGGTVLTVLGIGNSIGIGTANPRYLLDIRSPVSTGQTALYIQGDARITGDLTLDDITLDDATIQDLYVTSTSTVDGFSLFNSNVLIDAALKVSGVSTLGGYVDINNSVDISGALNVSGITTLGVTTITQLYVSGVSTLGGYVDINNSVDISNNLNVSGIATIGTVSIVGAALSSLVVSGVSTLGTVKIFSGIITASSGIVTYYGNGQYLDLRNNPSTGIGIGTTGGLVGYGITFLDLRGAGVSTTFYDSSVGIATIFFEGGGSGTIGIGTEFPTLPAPTNGDLFYHANYGRIFVYYDEDILGIGTDAFWVDAAPFNVGILSLVDSLTLAQGSASFPTLNFNNDVNTGLFSSGTGQQTFVSAGSSILNINPSGINVSGIVTATSFVGSGANLTGISSVSFATTSFGLSGTPNITVGVVTASGLNVGTAVTVNSSGINVSGVVTATSFVGGAATFTNLTVNGTQTIINTTSLEITDKTIGIGSTSSPTDALADGAGIIVYGTTNKTLTYNNTKKAFEFNTPLNTIDTRFLSVAEKSTRINGNTVSLVYNTGGGNIAICTNPSGPITLNVTGIPTGVEFDNHTLTFSVVAIQTATGYACTSVTLNGASVTLRHSGGSVAVGNTSCADVFNFVGLNTVGSASTTSNYLVLTNLNGLYRA